MKISDIYYIEKEAYIPKYYLIVEWRKREYIEAVNNTNKVLQEIEKPVK